MERNGVGAEGDGSRRDVLFSGGSGERQQFCPPGAANLSPLIIGEAAQLHRADRWAWRHAVSLQSPHHRGSRSTLFGVSFLALFAGVSAFSPLIIGEAAQLIAWKVFLIELTSPFSPLIIGEAAQQSETLDASGGYAYPSVPSSSGKPLNSTLEKVSSGAGFRRGFEEPPENVRSYRPPFGSTAGVAHRKSPCLMRVSGAVEKGPRVLGPKELLQTGTSMPPDEGLSDQECTPRPSQSTFTYRLQGRRGEIRRNLPEGRVVPTPGEA
jgi:hypothetical protein